MVVVDMWERDFTNPFFDFSKVPHVSISVEATFNVEYKFRIPVCVPCFMKALPCEYQYFEQSAWSKNKPNLQKMFLEDLSGYDVARTRSCTVMITRRSEAGWAPVRQIHLEGDEAVVRERKAMDDYYAMRTQQKLGRFMC
jgi:hypothetical protein